MTFVDADSSKLVLPETHTQFVKTLKWRQEYNPRQAASENHDKVYDTVGYCPRLLAYTGTLLERTRKGDL
jgi:hypothetical protein